MIRLHKAALSTEYGEKTVSAYFGDILDFSEHIDILVTSAYAGSYAPTPRTVFNALDSVGISARELSSNPAFDLRKSCNVWLSEKIRGARVSIGRIGCVEFSHYRFGGFRGINEKSVLSSIKTFFKMLDIAETYGVEMETVVLPLLGAGSQGVSGELTVIPLLNECVSFLKRNHSVKRICFVERNLEKAEMISSALKNSYNLFVQEKKLAMPACKDENGPLAFISHSSCDRNFAHYLCHRLEENGVKVWYAPRDVVGDYATAITEAIRRSTHFVIILSENSMKSQHVLNEIDLAFQGLPDKIKFKPLRIDESEFTPSVEYYLSRQHWLCAIDPPLEKRLDEFVDSILSELRDKL